MSPQGRPGHNKGRTFPAESLTSAEVLALVSAFNQGPTGKRNAALVALLYWSGLRVSEALALKASNVDLGAGEVQVNSGKGDKARTVGLDASARPYVMLWLDARRKLGLKNGPLLCALNGKPWTPQAAREALYRAGRKAGIDKRVHPHGLRHSHAADLARRGMPTPLIQRQLGHVNLATTDRYLSGIAPVEVVEWMKAHPWETPEP